MNKDYVYFNYYSVIFLSFDKSLNLTVSGFDCFNIYVKIKF